MTAKDAAKPLSHGTLLGLLSLQALAFTAGGLLLWHFSERPIGDFITIDFRQVLHGCLLGLAFILAAAGVFGAFPRFAERMVRLQGEAFSFLKNRLSMPAIAAVSICAGVGEEALFRGGMQTFLGGYLGPVAAILVSSAFFALIHLSKPVIVLLLFGISAIFGAIYWLTGSLLTVMIGHALYDVFALHYLQRELHRLGYFDHVNMKQV